MNLYCQKEQNARKKLFLFNQTCRTETVIFIDRWHQKALILTFLG
jgi:hypothetical protein